MQLMHSFQFDLAIVEFPGRAEFDYCYFSRLIYVEWGGDRPDCALELALN